MGVLGALAFLLVGAVGGLAAQVLYDHRSRRRVAARDLREALYDSGRVQGNFVWNEAEKMARAVSENARVHAYDDVERERRARAAVFRDKANEVIQLIRSHRDSVPPEIFRAVFVMEGFFGRFTAVTEEPLGDRTITSWLERDAVTEYLGSGLEELVAELNKSLDRYTSMTPSAKGRLIASRRHGRKQQRRATTPRSGRPSLGCEAGCG
jgi:hypothetical protein